MSPYKSPLVSCLICKEVKSARGIFGHHSFAHTEEGRNLAFRNGKASSLNHTKQKEKALNLRSEYNVNPILCKLCNNPHSYNSKNNKFCSSSCAATHNNNSRNREHHARQSITLKNTLSNRHIFPKPPKPPKISQCVICNNFFDGSRKSCSIVCRNKILSNIAKANPKMGGNKNTRAHGWYESRYAGRVWLESSYEYKVAKSLDENDINWIRPSYLPYGDKKYYADFYLIDFDVYLDPKNDYLISLDIPKINQVMKENSVKIVILDKTQLNWKEIYIVLKVRLELT